MNETPISQFAHSEANREWEEGSQLRPFEWSELTARLAAMRDLRQSLAGVTTSFGVKSGPLAGLHSCSAFTDFAEVREELAHDTPTASGSVQVNKIASHVNPKALADGKGPAVNSSVEPNCVTPGDRELI